MFRFSLLSSSPSLFFLSSRSLSSFSPSICPYTSSSVFKRNITTKKTNKKERESSPNEIKERREKEREEEKEQRKREKEKEDIDKKKEANRVLFMRVMITTGVIFFTQDYFRKKSIKKDLLSLNLELVEIKAREIDYKTTNMELLHKNREFERALSAWRGSLLRPNGYDLSFWLSEGKTEKEREEREGEEGERGEERESDEEQRKRVVKKIGKMIGSDEGARLKGLFDKGE